MLATVRSGEFFCYLGCKRLFQGKASIMKHYCEDHDNEFDRKSLWKWGMNVEALKFQLRKKEMGVTKYSKAQRDRRCDMRKKVELIKIAVAKNSKLKRLRRDIGSIIQEHLGETKEVKAKGTMPERKRDFKANAKKFKEDKQ